MRKSEKRIEAPFQVPLQTFVNNYVNNDNFTNSAVPGLNISLNALNAFCQDWICDGLISHAISKFNSDHEKVFSFSFMKGPLQFEKATPQLLHDLGYIKHTATNEYSFFSCHS